MPLNHYTFNVTDAAPVRLTPANKEAGSSITIHIQNYGTHDVFIGGEGLTHVSYGRHLNNGESISFENLTTVDEIYALAETGTSTTVAVVIIKR